MPRASNNAASNATSVPPTAAPYSLRGKRYTYSHTAPPCVPPPPNPEEREAVPESAVRQKPRAIKRVGVTPAAAAASQSAPPQNTESVDISQTMSDGHDAGQCSLQTESQGANNEPTPEGVLANIDPLQASINLQRQEGNLHNRVDQGTFGHAGCLQHTPRRCPDIEIVQPTPDRTNRGARDFNTPSRAGVSSISGPSPTLFRMAPSWATDFDDTYILNAPFIPNPALPLGFPLATQITNPTAPLSADPFFESSYPTVSSQHINGPHHIATLTNSLCDASTQPQQGFNPNSLQPFWGQAPHGAPVPPNNHLPAAVPDSMWGFDAVEEPARQPNFMAHAPQAPAATQRQSPDLATLHSTIARSLRPLPRGSLLTVQPRASLSVPPSRGPSPAPPVSGRSGSTGPSSRSHSPAPPVPAGPLRPNTPVSRGPSPTPSLEPTTSFGQAPASSECQLPPPNHVTNARSVRVGHMTYNRAEYVKYMTYCWHWFLVAENAFPIDTAGAQELCISYAEEMVGIPRAIADISKLVFDYVRVKDSRIRNTFLRGAMAKVEALYNVTWEALLKVQELANRSNFIFDGYDPLNLVRVSGRYRHPCISAVLNEIVFPILTRGVPVGARFIHDMMAVSPPMEMANYRDKDATYGAPPAAIAMACTVILHCFHILEQTHVVRMREQNSNEVPGRSKNKGKSKKSDYATIPFEERKYAQCYRGYLKELKDYHRLDEVRRFHMKSLLIEYAERFPNGATSGTDDQDEVERMSDGE